MEVRHPAPRITQSIDSSTTRTNCRRARRRSSSSKHSLQLKYRVDEQRIRRQATPSITFPSQLALSLVLSPFCLKPNSYSPTNVPQFQPRYQTCIQTMHAYPSLQVISTYCAVFIHTHLYNKGGKSSTLESFQTRSSSSNYCCTNMYVYIYLQQVLHSCTVYHRILLLLLSSYFV